MIKLQKSQHNKLAMCDMVKLLRTAFGRIPDSRASNTVHSLVDVLTSAFAVFALKYPSLLSFQEQTPMERHNLKQLFELEHKCSDSQMRRILDEISPDVLNPCFSACFNMLQQLKVLRSFLFRKKHLLLSVDGVHYFHSNKIKCKRCQVTHHKNGDISYQHSMLGAVLVHPQRREVFPLACQHISKQDGQSKNDCELNAAKRLLADLSQRYEKQPLVLITDALFANQPHLQEVLNKGWNFITSVKPTKHAHLFKRLETRLKIGRAKSFCLEDGPLTHYFAWANDLHLNQEGPLKVNFLYYEQRNPKTLKPLKFSWVTSFTLRKDNVYAIMRAGRSRWKIENETFNTLKNQGYHFNHNFGHGYNYLCNTLATMMMIAFLVDQMIQACSKNFRDIWQAAHAKIRLWERMRAIFSTVKLNSFDELTIRLAYLHLVKLE